MVEKKISCTSSMRGLGASAKGGGGGTPKTSLELRTYFMEDPRGNINPFLSSVSFLILPEVINNLTKTYSLQCC